MLNELEKDKLQQLLYDDLLLSIIKKVFKFEAERSKPEVNAVDNDQTLGQKYRAYIEADDIIKKCFRELEGYKEVKNSKERINRAI